MKATGGVEVYLHSYLSSSLDGVAWSTSRSGRSTPGKNPGTHCTVGLVGRSAGLEILEMRAIDVWGTRWRSWFSRKVAGSISDGVTGIFHWHNLSGRTMALGSTQPLTEMSTRNIYWGVKAAGAYGWQPYHLHMPIVLKSGSLSLLEPCGPVQACTWIALRFPVNVNVVPVLNYHYAMLMWGE